MFKKTRKIALIGGALAAVSFGGSALAAAGAAPVQPTHAAVTTKATADKETADGANANTQQAGDTETADGATNATQAGTDTETADGTQGAADTGPNVNIEEVNNEADEGTSDGGSAQAENGS
jgi:hypothetical protein